MVQYYILNFQQNPVDVFICLGKSGDSLLETTKKKTESRKICLGLTRVTYQLGKKKTLCVCVC